ncbi:MAG: hypothetical protein V1797_07365 [Pseudomonadota bacterium]
MLLMVGLLAACQGLQPQERQVFDWQPKRVAVLPFAVATGDDEGSVRSPLTGASFRPGAVAEGAGLALDASLGQQLGQVASFQVVPAGQTGAVMERLRRENISLDLMQAVQTTGKKLKADGVLIGFIYRFAQRVGGPYAADRPASAAFDLAMVRVSDGAVLWKNSFDETQKAFSENILNAGQYMDRGLRWFTVQEWGDIGMGQLLERLPWRKEAPPAGKAAKE